jgi:hypothetical protein
MLQYGCSGLPCNLNWLGTGCIIEDILVNNMYQCLEPLLLSIYLDPIFFLSIPRLMF